MNFQPAFKIVLFTTVVLSLCLVIIGLVRIIKLPNYNKLKNKLNSSEE